ncbi:BPL-N domain-containing protein [Vibrio penaeicida]|uniref:BPL-N domain-containing protein n=1 Tax=Vibrio penaeicida TaxID=104609 RepID=UPI002733A61E|nr:BPL-N domain-containing protein [Vibrio penaeicida]MDP2572163.1 BPL-N domain-containing protein [Vibrio penaeicida]
MKTLIYTDNVSNNHILYYALAKLRGKQNVFFVNANEILEGALSQDIDLFVMPGGASRYKSAKLNGKANTLIKDYVANGGFYLGICAGAYMACARTLWAKNSPFEIETSNELAFFNGTAEGPIECFGAGDNFNNTKPNVVSLNVLQGSNTLLQSSLYMGGSLFKAKPDEDVDILATFADLPNTPAAVIKGKFGKGRYILSSTHPEYDAEAIDLMRFDVIGNEYLDFTELENAQSLNLGLLAQLLTE